MKRVFFLLITVAAFLLVSAPAQAQVAASGRVTVVNAVENVDTDLYLDGSTIPAISGFRYTSLTDPLLLSAGRHIVSLREVGSPPSSTPLLEGSFEVPADGSLSLVAFKGVSGLPLLVVFADEEPTRPGQALLRFRQVAIAPEVDVLVDGQRVFHSVPNAEHQATAPSIALSPGARTMSVVRAGTDDILVPPKRVQLAGGAANSIYLVGSQGAFGSSLAVVAENQSSAPQVVTANVAPAPNGVPAGVSGLLDLDLGDPRALAKTVSVTMVVAGALFLAVATWSRHRRRLPNA